MGQFGAHTIGVFAAPAQCAASVFVAMASKNPLPPVAPENETKNLPKPPQQPPQGGESFRLRTARPARTWKRFCVTVFIVAVGVGVAVLLFLLARDIEDDLIAAEVSV